MNSEPDRIVRQEETGRSALRALHVSSEGPTTTVFRDERGGWYVPKRPPTAADIVLRAPKAAYTVDTAEHPERFDAELPSKGEAFFFRAAISLVWQVQDAVKAVASGLSHPEEAYRPQVEEILRGVARKHSIEKSAAAERAMNDTFATPRATAQGVVVTRCAVQLSLDDRTQEHVAARTLAERSLEARELEHKARQQEGELSNKEASLTNQLQRQAAEHEQELAELAARHEQQLLKERMSFYADALAGGNFNLIALKLAGSNQDVDEVIGLIMRQRNLDVDAARGMLTTMVEEGLVNRSQVLDLLARINAVMSVSDHLTSPTFASPGPSATPLPSDDAPITIDGSISAPSASDADASKPQRSRHSDGEDDEAARDNEDEDELP